MPEPSSPSVVRVQVLLFSVLREQVGAASLAVELPAAASGEALLQQLTARYPLLAPYRTFIRLAVNAEYVPHHTVLHDGDEVALITPVSGG
jgi:molybdopterin converting factor subunit 1